MISGNQGTEFQYVPREGFGWMNGESLGPVFSLTGSCIPDWCSDNVDKGETGGCGLCAGEYHDIRAVLTLSLGSSLTWRHPTFPRRDDVGPSGKHGRRRPRPRGTEDCPSAPFITILLRLNRPSRS